MITALHTLLLVTLLVIIVIDMREQIIPDILNLVVLGLGVATLLIKPDSATDHIISAVALGGIGALLAGPYSAWRGRDMLGWGDVKFMFAAGLWLPFTSIGWFLALAGGLGVVFSLVYRRITGRAETPFAPALCISLAVMVATEMYASLAPL